MFVVIDGESSAPAPKIPIPVTKAPTYILYLVLPCFSKFILFSYAYMESNLKKVDKIIQFFKAGRKKSIKFIRSLTSGRLPSHDSVDQGFFLSQSKLSIPLQSFGQQNLVLLLIYPMNPRT